MPQMGSWYVASPAERPAGRSMPFGYGFFNEFAGVRLPSVDATNGVVVRGESGGAARGTVDAVRIRVLQRVRGRKVAVGGCHKWGRGTWRVRRSGPRDGRCRSDTGSSTSSRA